MKVEKAALVAMLLEAGEENAAVLLARSTLPDHLDTTRDLDTLLAFGLDRDHLDAVASLAVGAIEADDVTTRRAATSYSRRSLGAGRAGGPLAVLTAAQALSASASRTGTISILPAVSCWEHWSQTRIGTKSAPHVTWRCTSVAPPRTGRWTRPSRSRWRPPDRTPAPSG